MGVGEWGVGGGGRGMVHTWVLGSGGGETREGSHLGVGKCSWFGTPDTTGQFYFLCSSVSCYIKI